MSQIKYLNQDEAKKLDEDLMSETQGFINEQLMELAGLSSACAITEAFPLEKFPLIFLVIGPGNNGGDGMVAARHLHHFGYHPTLFYPKPKDIPPFKGLLRQCKELEIPVLEKEPNLEDLKKYHVIVDAIFGYSFRGDIRAPFDRAIEFLNSSKVPIFSIDIPSGWDVEKGNVNDKGIKADVLISLTAPKLGVKEFQGKHYLGGRFVSKNLEKKYNLNLPKFPGTQQFVLLPH
eukprot:TRINITY_DN6409_c0_g1_i4.p1 TRINITY_DN6409_c0_g1~~TRINITY_DN6409_c0_g1_i4.p1  ORF type:complete len:258 (+),score=54.81 TRINITY_DN6409_c0_g1_i4:76-774(+)